MSESIETPASKAAARQAKLLAKSKERLAKITGAAKGEGRIASDSKFYCFYSLRSFKSSFSTCIN